MLSDAIYNLFVNLLTLNFDNCIKAHNISERQGISPFFYIIERILSSVSRVLSPYNYLFLSCVSCFWALVTNRKTTASYRKYFRLKKKTLQFLIFFLSGKRPSCYATFALPNTVLGVGLPPEYQGHRYQKCRLASKCRRV